MAVKPLKSTAIILVLIIAGIGVTMLTRSRLSYDREEDRTRFISAYIGLSIAREKYLDAESLWLAENEVYSANEVDPAWMAAYVMTLTKNMAKSGLLWEEIVGKLDSIRQATASDTLTNLNPR